MLENSDAFRVPARRGRAGHRRCGRVCAGCHRCRRWTWRPQGAFDANNNTVFQYTPYTDVRLASYGRVVATRYGATSTIWGSTSPVVRRQLIRQVDGAELSNAPPVLCRKDFSTGDRTGETPDAPVHSEGVYADEHALI
jgi:hypothetical protein